MPLARGAALLGKPRPDQRSCFVANHGRRRARPARSSRASRPTLAPLGLEADNSKQDALELADEQGAAFMSIFTTFGSFSIAAGILLIFLIFVMLAAERRSELGIARAVGTRRGHLVQMFLFEGLAYDLLAAAVGALLGAGRRLRDGARDGGRVRARSRTSTIAFSVTAAQRGHRLRDRRAADARGRRLLRLARQPDEHRHGDPQPARAAGRRRAARALGRSGAVGVVARRRCWRSRASRRSDAITLGFGVLLLVLGLVPDRSRARARTSGSCTPAPGSRSSRGSCLPMSRWLLRRPEDELLDLHPRRARDRGRRRAGRSCTTPTSCSRGLTVGLRSQPPARAGPEALDRVSAREPVPHRRHARDVHARRLHARRRGHHDGLVRQRLQQHRHVRRRLRRPRHHVAGEPDPRHARDARARRPAYGAGDFRVVSSQSVLPVKAHQVGHDGEAGDLSRARRRPRVPRPHDLRLRRDGDGLRLGRRRLGRAPRSIPNLAVVDALVAPRKQNYNFGAASDVPRSPASTSRTRRSPRSASMCAIRRRAGSAHLTVIGVLSDRSPLTMAGLWTSQAHARRGVRRPRRARPSTSSRSRPASTPSARAKTLESAFLANGMQADALKKVLADAVSASLTFDRLIEGFMGLGLIVGVAALGVDQRPLGRRAPPADRRPARHRVPPAAWSRRASCSSRRSSR